MQVAAGSLSALHTSTVTASSYFLDYDTKTVAFTVGDTTTKLYIDGVLIDSTAKLAVTGTATGISIGQDSGGANHFYGNISSISFYNDELTASEVTFL